MKGSMPRSKSLEAGRISMKYKLQIQYFGTGSSKAGKAGGGSAPSGGGGGAQTPAQPQPKMPSNGTQLYMYKHYSQSNPQEVQDIMNVLADVEDNYGVLINNAFVQTGKKGGYLAMYNTSGNLKVNSSYFNSTAMTKAYDYCVKVGYHPSKGNKTAMEAVVAHELGHRLNHVAAGNNWYRLDSVADNIVKNAAKSMKMGNKVRVFRNRVSGYARKDSSECVAEAFADVYCNGSRAKAESRAVVNELNKYFPNSKGI